MRHGPVDGTKFAAIGAAIAKADSVVGEARNASRDVFYKLGFDIATGIFGDPALGAQGKMAAGPGSLGIRDSLSPAGQRGFNASMELNMRRRGKWARRRSGGKAALHEYLEEGSWYLATIARDKIASYLIDGGV
jgi:hypothetical protein